MNTKSTDRWVTVTEAARVTNRPENSISNWYLTDKVVRHKRISARRVLVNLADCIEQSDARVRRRRKPTPMAVRVVPAVVVDLVPFSLAGQQCQGWRIDGEELLDAGLLGRLLDYADKRLERCPYADDKPTCQLCPTHCYARQMREREAQVMRFSGPRMIFHHPIMVIRHLIHARRSK